MEGGKTTTGNNNNNNSTNSSKILVCIEEYPSIKNEVDGKDSPTIKKREEIYDLPSSCSINNNGTSHATSSIEIESEDNSGGDDEKNKGLEIACPAANITCLRKFFFLFRTHILISNVCTYSLILLKAFKYYIRSSK